MARSWRQQVGPWFLAGFGVALFAAAAVWHLGVEASSVVGLGGPVAAFLLDGLLPLLLVYASYRLVRSGFDGERIWTVFVWSFVGACLFLFVVGLSIAIRELEGRTIAEPAFVLLLAADAGALGGAVAGYYAAKARDDAEQAAKASSTLQFVNGLLRHDIRNSLTVIEARVDLLDAEVDSDRGQKAAATIRDQIDEIVGLAENAGAVAATLSSDPDLERIDLAAVAADVVEGIDATRDATLSIEGPDSAPVWASDAVRPVVRNLVENAVEHGSASPQSPAPADATEHGTDGAGTASEPSADVTVTVTETDDTVELAVADRGPGIPDAEKDDIFAPRAGDTHGGGLHLVETLVESFDGAIRVEDNDPTGARFVVELARYE